MANNFDISEFERWQRQLIDILDKELPREKERELKKIGLIAKGETQEATPVDTGRLRNSFSVRVVDKNSVAVSNNTEYAIPINDGHRVGSTFVRGQHFMERGLQNSKEAIRNELDNWFEDMFNKISR